MAARLPYAFTKTPQILWNPDRTKAAGLLAAGYSKQHVANEVGVSRETIYDWLAVEDFAAEVDRLSLMVGIASRAERLRIAMRVVRQKIDAEGFVTTNKDVLDWIKYAQSETDGVKLDMSKLAELGNDASGGGQESPSPHQVVGPGTQALSPAIDVESSNSVDQVADGPLDQPATSDNEPPT